ncbi:hypothetical protein LAUMK191_03826 [Mycobacterium attenuatum]|nr:hypothetical protein LAUMK191_03826 [Mycobacterium attenuatum]VBA60343.1 hypothetical protein LAUMK41_03956 [Mycobacterium attenuatum]
MIDQHESLAFQKISNGDGIGSSCLIDRCSPVRRLSRE